MAEVTREIDRFLEGFYSRVRVTPPRYAQLQALLSGFKDVDWDSLSKNPSSTPSALVELSNKFKENVYGYDALIKLKNFKPVEYLNKYSQAKTECMQIKEDGGGHFRCIDGVNIETLIKDVLMYDASNDIDFNFGSFQVIMCSDRAYCNPYGDNTKNPDGFYHPYLSKGEHQLCFGEHKLGYESAMKQGRFFDAFNIIKTVMSFYGGDDLNGQESGPHMALFNWAGQRCAICDDIFKPQDGGFSCHKSDEPICISCGEDDDNRDVETKLVYLPQFLSKCETCEKNTINVRNKKCTKCRLDSKASKK